MSCLAGRASDFTCYMPGLDSNVSILLAGDDDLGGSIGSRFCPSILSSLRSLPFSPFSERLLLEPVFFSCEVGKTVVRIVSLILYLLRLGDVSRAPSKASLLDGDWDWRPRSIWNASES